jgi:hypothetical protein
MNRKRAITLTVVVLASGGMSFVAARLAASRSPEAERAESVRWLSGAPAAVIGIEEDFNKQADKLVESLLQEQSRLAVALEDPCTPDDAVLAQVETVIAAHERLLRQVGEHIVTLRLRLPEAQRERLMNLCADMVRGPLVRAGGRGAGYGRGGGMGFRGGSGVGRGAGGQGYGGGGGYGQRRRFRGGLAQGLELTQEQTALAQQQDPNFEADAAQLRGTLLAERAKLLAAFEAPQITNVELLAHIEKLISAHSQIERRIAEHVLVLRPHLTADQQKWLIGLCRRARGPS